MKIYIVTREPFHDNSTILGAFSSLEKAEADPIDDKPVAWRRSGFYVGRWDQCVAESTVPEAPDADSAYLIFELEVDAVDEPTSHE